MTVEPDKTLRFDGRLPTGPGADEKVSLLVFHRDGARIVPLAEGHQVVIGRCPPVDVLIQDETLSRQHARFELISNEVWVEDLESTNGTWIDGQRISREKVIAGMEVQIGLGGVIVGIHMLKPRETPVYNLNSHDQFLARLDEEMSRGRAFGEPVAVMDVQCAEKGVHVSQWFQLIRTCFRRVDTLALYSSETIEALMPGLSPDACRALAERVRDQLRSRRPGFDLVFGIAVFPFSAVSSESLILASRNALLQATPSDPVRFFEMSNVRSSGASTGHAPIVRNQTMRDIYDAARRLARETIPVLIQGETGTGKELLAQTLHEGGNRRDHPICCVNCAAIPAQLVESTLFGHERGAFTGADRDAIGLFEQADSGTILLDEIGELPLAAQGTLLRVLESGKIMRVGSTKERSIDVRVVSSTNRELEAMCRTGAFRWDLYYRINVICLRVPPLRERRDEIPAMAEYFIDTLAQARMERPKTIESQAMQRLVSYSWPGNVRELRNVIERAVFMARGDSITVEDLPAKIQLPVAEGNADRVVSDPRPPQPTDIRARMEQQEVETIRKALEDAGYNQTEAAKLIGMPLRTFVRKVNKYGLKRKRQRSRDDATES